MMSLNGMAFAAGRDTWLDEGNFDASWYRPTDSSTTNYDISSAEQLAGLCHLVNEKNETFAGITINITQDIDLTAHRWVSIAESFEGTIEGIHRVTTLLFADQTPFTAGDENIQNITYSVAEQEHEDSVPQTGDPAQLALWTALAAGSAAGMRLCSKKAE